MKARRALLVLGLIAIGFTASAQKPQVTVSVRQKLAGDTEQNSTRYTSTKEKDRTCELTVMLRNNDPVEHKLKLAWYFVGNPLQGDMADYVYDKGEQDVILAPRATTNVVQKSLSIESKIAVGRRKVTKSGAKHLGYIVTLSQETNLLNTVTAPASLEKVARSAEAMAKLLAAPSPL